MQKCKIEHLLFLKDLLINYTVAIPTICATHKIGSSADWTLIANQVGDFVAPDVMRTMRQDINFTYISISNLRANRSRFLPAIEKVLSELNQYKEKEPIMSVNQTPAVMPAMNIQDLIKLRRLVSTSNAVASFLENVFLVNESRYAVCNANQNRIDPAKLVQQAVQAGVLSQTNFGPDQLPRFAVMGIPNPYAEIQFTTEQLNQADAKFLELMQILFPYPDDSAA